MGKVDRTVRSTREVNTEIRLLIERRDTDIRVLNPGAPHSLGVAISAIRPPTKQTVPQDATSQRLLPEASFGTLSTKRVPSTVLVEHFVHRIAKGFPL